MPDYDNFEKYNGLIFRDLDELEEEIHEAKVHKFLKERYESVRSSLHSINNMLDYSQIINYDKQKSHITLKQEEKTYQFASSFDQ